MHVERGRHAATPLSNGDILVTGGLNIVSGVLSTAEVFSANLVDTQPPQIFLPGNMTVFATGPEGVAVFYFVSVTDDIDPNPLLNCAPASGSTFPIGTTTVVCTASDASGNTATGSFEVTVIESLSLTVSIDGFGSVNSKSGVATVDGSVSCNRANTVFISGELIQTIANRAELRGSFFTQVECPAATVTWSASVTAQNGRFKAGKATVGASAFACDQFSSCDFEFSARDIQLRGK